MDYDRRKAKVAVRGIGVMLFLDLCWLLGNGLWWVLLVAVGVGFAALMCFEPYFNTFKPFKLHDQLPYDQKPLDIASRSQPDKVYRVYPETFVYLPVEAGTEYRVRFTYLDYNWLTVQLIHYVPWVFESTRAYAYRSFWFGVLSELLRIQEFDATIGVNTVETLRKISDARESSAVELVSLMAFTATHGTVLGNKPDLANYAIKELLTRMGDRDFEQARKESNETEGNN